MISSSFTLDKPEFIDEASTNVVSWINHETHVWCVAKGVPLPEIKWNRDGTETSLRQSSERILSNLTFTPKEEKDFGSYTCTATNLLGSTKRKMTVVMLGKFDVHQVDFKKKKKNVKTISDINKYG